MDRINDTPTNNVKVSSDFNQPIHAREYPIYNGRKEGIGVYVASDSLGYITTR